MDFSNHSFVYYCGDTTLLSKAEEEEKLLPRLVSDESRCIGWLATVGCYARLASTVKSTAHEKPGLILSTSLGLTNTYRASRAFTYTYAAEVPLSPWTRSAGQEASKRQSSARRSDDVHDLRDAVHGWFMN